MNLYNENGFTRFDGLFSREYIDKINKIIDDLDFKVGETVFDEDKTGKIKQVQYLWRYHEEFGNIIKELRKIATQLTNYDELELSVINMQLFEKHPKISKPTRPHQDNAYFMMAPATPLTFWISLDDIDEENGCLYYAPKTHLEPTRKHQRYDKNTTFRVRSGVPGLSICLKDQPEETYLPMITQKGDVLVHNSNLIHSAGKNSSDNRRRRAIGLIFAPTECGVDPKLEAYHNENLKKDIELQKINNPDLYLKLKDEYLE